MNRPHTLSAVVFGSLAGVALGACGSCAAAPVFSASALSVRMVGPAPAQSGASIASIALPDTNGNRIWFMAPSTIPRPAVSYHPQGKAPLKLESAVWSDTGGLAAPELLSGGVPYIVSGVPMGDGEVVLGDSNVVRLVENWAGHRATTSFLATSCNNVFAPRKKVTAPGVELGRMNGLRLLERRATGALELKGWPAPSFGVALGDQVYVDGDADSDLPPEKKWSLFHEHRAERRVAPAELNQGFDFIYKLTFSARPIVRTLAALPFAMTWDDHEIRDGWGSHGDESSYSDVLSVAGNYFDAYQFSRVPAANRAAGGRQTYAPEALGRATFFSHGDSVHVYLLDGRSKRGWSGKVGHMLGTEQRQHFKEWMAGRAEATQPSLIVIGVPTPITARAKPGTSVVCESGVTDSGDDVRDSFLCLPDDQNEILRAVWGNAPALLRNHHRVIFVAGDVHTSGVVAIRSIDPELKSMLVYEIISSGVANENRPAFLENAGRWDGSFAGGYETVALGAVFDSPSFAEILVRHPPASERDAGLDPTPYVQVAFHVAVESQLGSPGVRRANLGEWSETVGTYPYPFVPGAGENADCDKLFAKEPARLPLVHLPRSWPDVTDMVAYGRGRSCLHALSVRCVSAVSAIEKATSWGDLEKKTCAERR